MLNNQQARLDNLMRILYLATFKNLLTLEKHKHTRKVTFYVTHFTPLVIKFKNLKQITK
jgi:hypothetical protein